MALTQTQLATAVAGRAQLSKADAKRALAALDEIVLDELGNAEKVRIGGVVQFTVRVRPAGRRARAATRRAVRRSPSPPSWRASTCARGHWRGRRERCRRCRRPIVGSLREQPGRAARFIRRCRTRGPRRLQRIRGEQRIAANGTPAAADRPSVSSGREFSACSGPIGSHDRAGPLRPRR